MLIKMKQDYCKECQRDSDAYFKSERQAEKCLSCGAETTQTDVIQKIPENWRAVLETMRPDIAEFIIG